MLLKRVSILLLGTALLLPASAFGQAQQRRFKELPVAADFQGTSRSKQAYLRKLRSQVMAVLRGQQPLEDQYSIPGKQTEISNRDLVDSWLGLYLLPRLTQVSNLGYVARERKELLTKFLIQARVPETRNLVLNKIYTTMVSIVSDEGFHPAVRYNALLTISNLNESEAANSAPPKPYGPATTFLLQQYQGAKTNAIRLGALVGLLRHVQLDRAAGGTFMAPDQKSQALTLSIQLLNQKAPAGSNASGHVWLQRRAIDVLAALGTPAGGVIEKITGIIGDETAPLALRLTAAQALGQLKLDAGGQLNRIDTARKLGRLAVLACRQEAARVAARKQIADAKKARADARQNDGGGGGMGAMGGGGMAAMMQQQGGGAGGQAGMMAGAMGGGKKVMELLSAADRRKVHRSTLRIRAELYAVYLGLGRKRRDTATGLMLAANDGEMKEIQRITNGLIGIVQAMDNIPKTADSSKKKKRSTKKDDKKEELPKAEKDLDTVLVAVNAKVMALESLLPAKQVPAPVKAPAKKAGPVNPAAILNKGG